MDPNPKHLLPKQPNKHPNRSCAYSRTNQEYATRDRMISRQLYLLVSIILFYFIFLGGKGSCHAPRLDLAEAYATCGIKRAQCCTCTCPSSGIYGIIACGNSAGKRGDLLRTYPRTTHPYSTIPSSYSHSSFSCRPSTLHSRPSISPFVPTCFLHNF